MTISAPCFAAAGDIHVIGNLTVSGSGGLAAVLSANSLLIAANITVDGNVVVAPGGALFLGCDLNFLTCLTDPRNTLATSDVMAGS